MQTSANGAIDRSGAHEIGNAALDLVMGYSKNLGRLDLSSALWIRDDSLCKFPHIHLSKATALQAPTFPLRSVEF